MTERIDVNETNKSRKYIICNHLLLSQSKFYISAKSMQSLSSFDAKRL